jgi:hypothetical protein
VLCAAVFLLLLKNPQAINLLLKIQNPQLILKIPRSGSVEIFMFIAYKQQTPPPQTVLPWQ